MDFIRQGRYVIPSFLFFLSLWWANSAAWEQLTLQQLTAVLAVLAAATLPLGFFIGGVSVLLLRLVFLIATRGDSNYEVRVSQNAWAKISEYLDLSFNSRKGWTRGSARPPPRGRAAVVAGSTFQLELPGSIFLWIDRRWNAFNVYINFLVAILCSYIYGLYGLALIFTASWIVVFSLIAVVCLLLALLTWGDVMTMTEMQAQRIRNGKLGPDHNASSEPRSRAAAGGETTG